MDQAEKKEKAAWGKMQEEIRGGQLQAEDCPQTLGHEEEKTDFRMDLGGTRFCHCLEFGFQHSRNVRK